MKTPQTYNGFNTKNERIATETGQDANDFINPAEVQKKITNIYEVMKTQCGALSKALRNEAESAETAIIVKGTHMGDPINDTASTIDKLPDAIYKSLQEVFSTAEKVHDQVQDAANDDAKDRVKKTAGFDHFG